MNGEPQYPAQPTCDATGKLSHASEQAAKKAAKRLGHRPYFCEHCGGWHTTNVAAKKCRRYVRKRRGGWR